MTSLIAVTSAATADCGSGHNSNRRQITSRTWKAVENQQWVAQTLLFIQRSSAHDITADVEVHESTCTPKYSINNNEDIQQHVDSKRPKPVCCCQAPESWGLYQLYHTAGHNNAHVTVMCSSDSFALEKCKCLHSFQFNPKQNLISYVYSSDTHLFAACFVE